MALSHILDWGVMIAMLVAGAALFWDVFITFESTDATGEATVRAENEEDKNV